MVIQLKTLTKSSGLFMRERSTTKTTPTTLGSSAIYCVAAANASLLPKISCTKRVRSA
jgi:hypothetical protein